MASSTTFSTVDKLSNYKKQLESLLLNCNKTIQLLEKENKTENADKIKELHDNVLAIKRALKDIEVLKMKAKFLRISSRILEDDKEIKEYREEIELLQKKKDSLKKELFSAQEKCMDTSIKMAELRYEIEQLILVNICPFKEEKVESAPQSDYISISTQTEKGFFEKGTAEATTQTENFEEESSIFAQHVSSPNFQ